MATSKIKIKKVCEWCGREFYAQKLTTKYCCKQCNGYAYKANKRRTLVNQVELETAHKPIDEIKEMEYLSVRRAAQLVGLSIRATYDLIYRGQLRATKLTSRLTLIRRADIEAMLTGTGYTKRLKCEESKEISEFYTTQEVLEKFHISNAWLFRLAKQHSIPKVFHMGKSHWSKKHIDELMRQKSPDESITEWYSTAELMEKFGMTTSAVYSFVSDNKIPKKRINREAFYSKTHIDILKGVTQPPKKEYYTMKEAMEKFDLTRDQLYHYTKKFSIPKIMEGKYVKYSKPEMDEALAGPTIKRG